MSRKESATLTDESIRTLIDTLHKTISEIGEQIAQIRRKVERDKEDQWKMINELAQEVENLRQKRGKK